MDFKNIIENLTTNLNDTASTIEGLKSFLNEKIKENKGKMSEEELSKCNNQIKNMESIYGEFKIKSEDIKNQIWQLKSKI